VFIYSRLKYLATAKIRDTCNSRNNSRKLMRRATCEKWRGFFFFR